MTESDVKGTADFGRAHRFTLWFRPDLYYGWVLAIVLGITTIVSYGTNQYLFGVVLVPVTQALHAGRTGLSGAYAAGIVFAGILGVPIGRWVDRHGARLPMALGSTVGGVSLLGLAAAHDARQFALVWAVGLGSAAALTYYPVSFTVLANWFQRRRGTALALLTLLGGLASPLFIPLVGIMIPHLGWRSTLVILAVVQLCVALPLHALLLRRHPEDLGLHPDGTPSSGPLDAPFSSGIALREALRGSVFWTLTVSSSLAMLGSMVIVAHQVAYLIGRGVGPVAAAGVAGLVGLVTLPGRYVLNALSDRIAARTLLALCLAMQAVGVLALMQATTLPIMIIYVVIYGVAFGAISPLRATVIAAYFGRRAYGAIIAAQGVPVALCAGLGPLAAGWLFDLQHSYTLALSLAAAAFVLAALGIVLTPDAHTDSRGELLER